MVAVNVNGMQRRRVLVIGGVWLTWLNKHSRGGSKDAPWIIATETTISKPTNENEGKEEEVLIIGSGVDASTNEQEDCHTTRHP